LFILRASFVIEGERFFVLFDDAMVSMRYAQNLAAGHGLVWNPGGEAVEGFTNPLWVLFMAGCHLLPLPPSKICILVQLAGILFGLGTILAVSAIVRILRPGSQHGPFVSALFTACYYPLVFWNLSGMEVGLVAFLNAIGTVFALRALQDGRPPLGGFLVFGIATWVRPDALVLLLVFWGYFMIVQPERRTANALVGALALLLFLGIQTASRWFYFGEFLPNTYYLKMTGYPVLLRIFRGGFVFLSFLWRGNLPVFALPFLVLLLRKRVDSPLILFLVFAQCLYSVYVGGDAWEQWGGANRYISVVIPLFFVCLALGVDDSIAFVRKVLLQARPQSVFHKPLYAIAVIMVLAFLNGFDGPNSLLEASLIRAPFTKENNIANVQLARTLREVSSQEARIAVTWAGALPYFVDRPCIDLLGKNDRVVARMPARRSASFFSFRDFLPGHNKYNYKYSIGQLEPDIVAAIRGSFDDLEPEIRARYRKAKVAGSVILVLRGSPHVHWESLKPLED
jgi:hypothetical protein